MSKNPQALKRYHFCFRNLAIIAQLCNSLSLPALYSQSASLHVFHGAEPRIQFLWAKSASIHAPFFPATTKRTLDLFKYQKMGGIQSHKKKPTRDLYQWWCKSKTTAVYCHFGFYLSILFGVMHHHHPRDWFFIIYLGNYFPGTYLSSYFTMGGNDLWCDVFGLTILILSTTVLILFLRAGLAWVVFEDENNSKPRILIARGMQDGLANMYALFYWIW